MRLLGSDETAPVRGSTVRAGRRLIFSFVFVMIGAIAGCAPAIQWRGYSYDAVQADGQRDRKLVFVYFRNWYSVECTKFEDQVLSSPPVVTETQEMYCVPLEFDTLVDRPFAEKWHLKQTPAFVVLSPDGRLLSSGAAPITQQQVLDAIRRAKAEFNATSRPAAPR